MSKIKLFILLNLFLFLLSCGSVKEAFTNQKKTSSDEFLVEKKSPLVMPPDYNKLPLPQSVEGRENNDEVKIKKLIVNNEDIKNQEIEDSNGSKNLEENLLKKIIKN